jgi:ribosomal 30S subunit maturation factor RimM
VKQDHGKDILLPVIDSVILEINIDAGEMVVHLLEGLVPDR